MNIFVLHQDPKECAQMHVDKHAEERGCLKCGTTTKNKKFCSRFCSNNYCIEYRKKANQHGVSKEKIKCKNCKEYKNYASFSRIEKFNKNSKKKDTCKKCSHMIRERIRRARNWKYKAKKVMINGAKQRAKRAGIEFSITEDDFEIPDICPVLGIKIHRTKRNNFSNSPSIDRIDNNKGYVPDNIMIVSRRLNILKKDATLKELVRIGEFYADFLSR